MTERCVVVLGPGRSGTSLTMKLLAASGLRLSTELEPASGANPDGHFEDLEISRLQQSFLHSLDLSPFLPRPADWVQAATYAPTRAGLIAAVQTEIGSADELWGFKDPRTCLTWPMWQEVFTAIDVEPATVFCSRDAASVVRSLMNTYGFSQPRSESLYLYRCLHALEDVTEPWFFAPYSEWATDGARLLTELVAYCGINPSGIEPAQIVGEGVSKKLDRQASGPPIELSGAVREMDALLASCVGTDYDAGEIADLCWSVKRRVNDFKFVSDALEMSRMQATEPGIVRGARRTLGRARRFTRRLGSKSGWGGGRPHGDLPR